MHKIEIYTRTADLDQLRSLLTTSDDIISYSRLKRNVRVLSTVSGSVAPAFEVHKGDTFKIEIYTLLAPGDIISRARSMDTVAGAEIYPCTQVDFEAESLTTRQKASPNTASDHVQPTAETGAPNVSCTCRDAGRGMVQLTVSGPKSPHFLYKIVGLVEMNSGQMTGGRKYRQGERDYSSLKIQIDDAKALPRLQSLLVQALTSIERDESQFEEIAAPPLARKAFVMDLDNSGPISVLHITADHQPLLRFAILEACGTHELDISIGRMAGGALKIQDVFYVRTRHNKKINPNLLPILEKTLFKE